MGTVPNYIVIIFIIIFVTFLIHNLLLGNYVVRYTASLLYTYYQHNAVTLPYTLTHKSEQ